MRPLLIASTLFACSPANLLAAPPAASSNAPAADLTFPATAASLPALVEDSAPTRAVACYALTSLHADAEQGRSQPRYERLSALWATEVLRQANGNAAAAEQRRVQAVAALRPTSEGVRRAAGVMCAMPPVAGWERMTEEQRSTAEMDLGGELYEAAEGPLAIADLPDLIGEGADQRTVHCQAFTALQAEAASAPETDRYQGASDRWASQNRHENDGDRGAAAQLMATTVAMLNNPPPRPPVLRAAANHCLAAAPAPRP